MEKAKMNGRRQFGVVLMPEHSSLRERMPPEAMDALLGPLDRAFGDGSPSIVDLRDSVPDSGFTDISHLNDEGRATFSPLLAEAIRQQAQFGQ